MHCILMSSPTGNGLIGSADWHIHRSVEVLAYHKNEECVRILVMVLAENLADAPNYLRFLHRGNVDCSLVTPSYPLPRHPDENRGSDVGILESVYGKAFKDCKGCVQEEALTPWDAWENVARRSITLYGGSEPKTAKFAPEHNVPSGGSYVPFCVWKLGPFDGQGFYLIAFSLEFHSQTYKYLVNGNDGIFSVDGPRRLLAAIKYRDLMNCREEAPFWKGLLNDFENHETAVKSDNYDVILLDEPLADKVNVRSDRCTTNGIHKAAQNQLHESYPAVRYVTTDPYFTLPLSYASPADIAPTASVA